MFIHSFSVLPSNSLPRQVLASRISSTPSRGIIPTLKELILKNNLPSLYSILNDNWSKLAWKRFVKKLTLAKEYSSFLNDCSRLPLSECELIQLGKPIPHWLVTRGDPKLTRLNSFRIRLLVGCHGLESDVCRFNSSNRNSTLSNRDPTCKLCGSGPEDHVHFVCHCPALSQFRNLSLLNPDLRSLFNSDPHAFLDVMLGLNWLDDPSLQHSIIHFLSTLRDGRNSLISAQ